MDPLSRLQASAGVSVAHSLHVYRYVTFSTHLRFTAVDVLKEHRDGLRRCVVPRPGGTRKFDSGIGFHATVLFDQGCLATPPNSETTPFYLEDNYSSKFYEKKRFVFRLIVMHSVIWPVVE
jgi:hypothetical protein